MLFYHTLYHWNIFTDALLYWLFVAGGAEASIKAEVGRIGFKKKYFLLNGYYILKEVHDTGI